MEELKNYFVAESGRWEDRIKYSRTIAAKDALYETLGEFRLFVGEYLEYFKKNRPPISLPALEERIKSTLLEYWVPLSMVVSQYKVPEYKDRLNRVHTEALGKFTENASKMNIELSGVLLYINKLPLSYFYPYTNRSFIALSWIADEYITNPDKSVLEADKVMALPHELGHHLYWNSNFGVKAPSERDILLSRLTLSNTVWEKLAAGMDKGSSEAQKVIAKMINSWTEEIFADMIGALISESGEKFAASAQNLIKRFCQDEQDMTYNDWEHPIACLRPIISQHTLELRNGVKLNMQSDVVMPGTMKVQLKEKNEKGELPPPVEIKMRDLQKALELAVDEIYAIITRGLKAAGEADRISNFGELLDFAEKEAAVHATKTFETLLTPLIFRRASYWLWCFNCKRMKTFVCATCGQ